MYIMLPVQKLDTLIRKTYNTLHVLIARIAMEMPYSPATNTVVSSHPPGQHQDTRVTLISVHGITGCLAAETIAAHQAASNRADSPRMPNWKDSLVKEQMT